MTAAKMETGPNLIPNAGLEEGEVGQAPKAWNVAAFQDDGTQVRVVNDQAHEGTCAALIEPAKMAAESKSAKTVYLPLGTVPFQPGQTYRLSIWMKSEDESTPVVLSAFSWKKDEHSWDVQSTAALTPEWRQYELLFRLPKEGDPEYKSTMDTFYWRINIPTGTSRFWIDGVSLREADLAGE
ncbi:MAG: carbohydrate binding domain-containing protein [Pirellulaceae bacterium]